MTLQRLLNVELPIIQAPMGGVQGSALAIAVSNRHLVVGISEQRRCRGQVIGGLHRFGVGKIDADDLGNAGGVGMRPLKRSGCAA